MSGSCFCLSLPSVVSFYNSSHALIIVPLRSFPLGLLWKHHGTEVECQVLREAIARVLTCIRGTVRSLPHPTPPENSYSAYKVPTPASLPPRSALWTLAQARFPRNLALSVREQWPHFASSPSVMWYLIQVFICCWTERVPPLLTTELPGPGQSRHWERNCWLDEEWV